MTCSILNCYEILEYSFKYMTINVVSELDIAKRIGQCAAMSLIEEVNTSPKPGLVDRITNGAHNDMTITTFYESAKALQPYFTQMALEGIRQWDNPEACFRSIRKIGIEAEKAMYEATSGVNTHKGLIFSLGILCACVGSCKKQSKNVTLESIICQEQKMVRRILLEELNNLNKKTTGFEESHGEHLYKRMGVTGVRGEAINGYKTVTEIGLPVMIEGLKNKRDFNQIKLQTLMTYMSSTEDTNVLSRTNPKTLKETQQIASAYLQDGGAYAGKGIDKLVELDKSFTEKNISHGGCADLLAITIFLVSVI